MFDFGRATVATVETEAQKIARGLRHRDIALLQALVEQYQFRLVRYLIYFLGSREEVNDLVQETWLRVLERGHSYDGVSRFEPWLFTIARNLALDHVRRRRVGSLDTASADGTNGEATWEAQLTVSSARSPFEEAARTEDAERVAKSLATLEPMYREALVLRFQEDLSLQEIAVVVGASVSTVASRVYRGLAALRTYMGESHAR
jgi:RNA polymerase sigma-70 factor (ECF subfamily)